MKKIVYLLVLYISAFAVCGVFLTKHLSMVYKHPFFLHVLGSFIVFAIIFKNINKKNPFYATLRHELCHWLFSVLFLGKPYSIHINPDGSGSYQHIGKVNTLVILAPYFFPIASCFLLLVSLFFKNPNPIYFIFMGMAFSFDVVSKKKDYHFQQTDWQYKGIYFSLQFSILMLLLFLVSCLTILFGGFQALPNLVVDSFLYLKTLIR